MAKKVCVLAGTGHRGVQSYIKPIVEDFSDYVECKGLFDAVRARAEERSLKKKIRQSSWRTKGLRC